MLTELTIAVTNYDETKGKSVIKKRFNNINLDAQAAQVQAVVDGLNSIVDLGENVGVLFIETHNRK